MFQCHLDRSVLVTMDPKTSSFSDTGCAMRQSVDEYLELVTKEEEASHGNPVRAFSSSYLSSVAGSCPYSWDQGESQSVCVCVCASPHVPWVAIITSLAARRRLPGMSQSRHISDPSTSLIRLPEARGTCRPRSKDETATGLSQHWRMLQPGIACNSASHGLAVVQATDTR